MCKCWTAFILSFYPLEWKVRQSYFPGSFPTLERRVFWGAMWLLQGMHLILTGHNAQRNIVWGGKKQRMGSFLNGDTPWTGPNFSEYNHYNHCSTTATASIHGLLIQTPKWWKPVSLTGLSTCRAVALKHDVITVVYFIAVVVGSTFVRNIFHIQRNNSQISLHQAAGNWWLLHLHWIVSTAWILKRIISNLYPRPPRSYLLPYTCVWVWL